MNDARLKKNMVNIITHAILIVIALSCVFPVFWMFSSSLKTQEEIFTKMNLFPDHWNWSNYVIAWVKADFGKYFLNSLIYTFCGVFGVVFISSLAAYGFARLEMWGKNIFFYLLISTLLIPIPGVFVPLYLLLKKLGLLDTRTGLILCYISGGLAFGIFLLRSFFEELPKEIEEAARIDGATKFGIYWRIALPLARPALATLVIFNCLSIWNEFLLALVVLQDTAKMPIQRGLMVFQGTHITDYPLLMAGLTIATIPVLVVYLVMQKHIIKGIASGALKG
ncbi:MAG: carbohydrate ABC transporter permease [Endomicrobiales bacterium]|jgi:multiple sugar transport system permease protein/raffinose/stachyose/melibiose transport system permease protein